MSYVTASIDQVGASPINIQWKVVRGDTATLKIEFLEDDEVTPIDISDWTFTSSSYDASGDTLDELTVEEYAGYVIITAISDITKLWNLRNEKYALQVCKHDYTPNSKNKFLGNNQTIYAKKNWSSLMLMDCSKCKTLTPEYVNTKSGLELHQFKWLDENLIGSIPLEWNWLVGEYPYKKDVHNIHFTEGGPYFKEYKNTEYANEWFNIYNMTKVDL